MSSDARTTAPGGKGGEPDRASSASGGGAPPITKSDVGSGAPATDSVPASTIERLLGTQQRRTVRMPDRIGPYRVKSVLASGGMGTVFLCEDERLEKNVAVKAAHPQLASQPGLLEQIREEGRRLASVKRNAYVARVLTAGDAPIDGVSVPYVAMEYEEGETLGGPISNAWPILKKVRLFTLVCKAVEALHEQHLVHADIKPSNVMLTSGAVEEPRLIDFGIARVVRRLGGEPGQLCAGTPGYFDPAVGGITGKAPDQRTDIYCLGLTLAAFLAGKEPNADQPSGWPSRGIPPSMENAAIDAELDAIILRAIERDPAKRWQSVREFRAALERWAAMHRVPSRALAMAVVLIVAATCGQYIGGPLARGLGLLGAFERAAFSTPLEPEVTLEHSAVVGLQSTDEVTQVVELLKASGTKFDAIDLASAKTWRPVYPELLKALRDSGARAVTFDIAFKNPTDVDALFYQTATECPFPIVVGLDLGSLEDNARDAPNQTILRWPLQWGGMSGFFGEEDAWCADVLARRYERFNRPTLSLRTVAAWHFPKMRHDFKADGWSSITIDAETVDPVRGVIPKPTQDVVKVRVSGTDIAQMTSLEDRRETGILESDRVSQVVVALPRQQSLDAITHSLINVLRATPAQRKAWFGGKAVFIANMTPVATDKYGTPDGRQVWAVFAHVVAFEAMMSGKVIRAASPTAILIACTAAASLPILASRASSRRRWISVAWPVVAGVVGAGIVVVVCLALLRSADVLVSPVPLMVSIIVAGLLVMILNVVISKRPR